MTEDLHHIDRLFKESIEEHKDHPSSRVWDIINNKLDKDNIIDIRKKYFYLKKIVIVLAVLLLGNSIYDLISIHEYKLKDRIISKESPVSLSVESKNEQRNNIQPGVLISRKENKFHVYPIVDVSRNQDLPIPIKKFLSEIASDDNYLMAREKIMVSPVRNGSNGQSNFMKMQPKSNSDKLLFNLITKNTSLEIKKPHNFKRSPFSISFFFSPELASYRIQNDKGGRVIEDKNEIRNREDHDISSTAGILFDYTINKRWRIQSGLAYSNTIILIKPKTIYAQADNNGSIKYLYNTSSGYGFVLPSFSNSPSIGDSLYAFTSTHTLQYAAIPVIAKYNIGRKRLKFNLFMGLAMNMLINGRIETSVEDGFHNEIENITTIHGLKSIYFSGLAGAGAEYDLNKKIALTFNPSARFALNSINMNASVKSYPNSFGFATGVQIKL